MNKTSRKPKVKSKKAKSKVQKAKAVKKQKAKQKKKPSVKQRVRKATRNFSNKLNKKLSWMTSARITIFLISLFVLGIAFLYFLACKTFHIQPQLPPLPKIF